MKIYGYNVATIAIIFIVALALLFAGRQLVYNSEVDKPLMNLFESMPQVKKWTLEKTDGPVTVNMKLGRVDDFYRFYADVTGKIGEILKDDAGRIVITDTRDALLEQVYYQMHIPVQEAIATGHFVDMYDRIKFIADTNSLDSFKVNVDAQKVVIELHKATRDLYEIVPRTAADYGPGGGEAGEGQWAEK